MQQRHSVFLSIAVFTLVPVAICTADDASEPAAAGIELFESKVRPLLLAKCDRCHGSKRQRAGLRLDTPEGIAAGSESGPVILAQKLEASPLLEVIRYTGEIKMPPKGKLSDAEIQVIVDWVTAGAPRPDTQIHPRRERRPGEPLFGDEDRAFWAFQPLRRPSPPEIPDTTWPKNDVDHFVLARLESAGLRPAPAAAKRTLLRRATFDLLGLPPTPQEVAAFVADDSSDSFAKVIDRLLASPHYGERWGRHWLDVARYSDSNGLDENQAQAHAFHYRDYVVTAFNKDKPYDQFVLEQIAGDLLPDSGDEETRAERITATGFLCLGPKSLAEVDEAKMEMDIVDEQISTVGKAFMGLTLGCARCHDHKFDPVPTEDYYSLAGIFRSTTTITKYQGPGDSKRGRWLEREVRKEPSTFVMAVSEGEPQNVRVHIRGSFLNQGQEVPRIFPRILAGEEQRPIEVGSGRLPLARWLSSHDHPLTSRVIVNRIWQGHFGAALVRTPDNFGRLGERPTHPELLDWLAAHLIASGWSIKKLHRTLMLSSTYRMSSTSSPDGERVDPDNRWLWRMPRRRLEAESIRDAILAISGRLDLRQGGSLLTVKNRKYTVDPKTFKHEVKYDARRRALYLPVLRNLLYDFFQIFDFPDPTVVNGQRRSTVVASQALYLMNSPFVMECAEAFAARLLQRDDLDREGRVRLLFETAYGRPPDEAEIKATLSFLARYVAALGTGESADMAKRKAWQSLCHATLASNESVHVD